MLLSLLRIVHHTFPQKLSYTHFQTFRTTEAYTKRCIKAVCSAHAGIWKIRNKTKQNEMKWNETRRFEWSERVWFHSIRWVWVWVCVGRFLIQQNKTKRNEKIFSIGDHLTCKSYAKMSSEREREKSDIVTNVLCTDNQQLTHTRSFCYVYLLSFHPSIHSLSYFFGAFFLHLSLMNTICYSSCKLHEL